MTTDTTTAPRFEILPLGKLHESKLNPRRVNARFFARADRSGGEAACWPWQGRLTNTGYGQFSYRAKTVLAHRMAVLLDGREIPAGLVIDHRCREPRCVNPRHLDVVSQRENVLRSEGPTAQHARQAMCLRGHAFTEENTLRRPTGRECRACRQLREKQRPRRDRAEYFAQWWRGKRAGKSRMEVSA